MIAIVSSSSTERAGFAALCDSRGWNCTEFDSVHSIVRHLQRLPFRVLLLRHRLGDGFSDDIIAALKARHANIPAKVVVLVGAGVSAVVEARQLSLGADCVQRDPIRTEVLQEYLAKYCAIPPLRMAGAGRNGDTLRFAGAILDPADRTLTVQRKFAVLTPREFELVEALHHSAGHVIRYEILYSDILGRKYRGDTSNMRVLLGKLTASTRSLGINLRRWVEVIPKSGYRYRPVR